MKKNLILGSMVLMMGSQTFAGPTMLTASSATMTALNVIGFMTGAVVSLVNDEAGKGTIKFILDRNEDFGEILADSSFEVPEGIGGVYRLLLIKKLAPEAIAYKAGEPLSPEFQTLLENSYDPNNSDGLSKDEFNEEVMSRIIDEFKTMDTK